MVYLAKKTSGARDWRQTIEMKQDAELALPYFSFYSLWRYSSDNGVAEAPQGMGLKRVAFQT